MSERFLENIYLNYKIDLVFSEDVPNVLIEALHYQENVNPLIWEFTSINKPTKMDCDYYFSNLISIDFINLTNDKFLFEIILFWWKNNQISIETLKFLFNSLSNSKLIEEDIYVELIYFVDFNSYDWDYEEHFNEIVDKIISESENTNLFNIYKPLNTINKEVNSSIIIEKSNKKDIIFKDFTFINWIQLILALPIFLIYIILMLLKKLVSKKYR